MSTSEEVLDDWEEIDDVQLNNQIHQIRREIDIATENQNGLNQMMIPPDDYYANSYSQRTKPTVKILQRPTAALSGAKSNEMKPKPPMKTLQQREQEYARARLRILGSAKNPEDDLEGTNSKIVVGSVRTPSKDDQDFKANTSVSALPDSSKKSESVVRMPKGPDGSPGFNFQR